MSKLYLVFSILIFLLSIIGCEKTVNPNDYKKCPPLMQGDRQLEKGEFDHALEWYRKVREDFPDTDYYTQATINMILIYCGRIFSYYQELNASWNNLKDELKKDENVMEAFGIESMIGGFYNKKIESCNTALKILKLATDLENVKVGNFYVYNLMKIRKDFFEDLGRALKSKSVSGISKKSIDILAIKACVGNFIGAADLSETEEHEIISKSGDYCPISPEGFYYEIGLAYFRSLVLLGSPTEATVDKEEVKKCLLSRLISEGVKKLSEVTGNTTFERQNRQFNAFWVDREIEQGVIHKREIDTDSQVNIELLEGAKSSFNKVLKLNKYSEYSSKATDRLEELKAKLWKKIAPYSQKTKTIRGLKLDMTEAKVKEIAGAPDEIIEAEYGDEYWIYNYPDSPRKVRLYMVYMGETKVFSIEYLNQLLWDR